MSLSLFPPSHCRGYSIFFFFVSVQGGAWIFKKKCRARRVNSRWREDLKWVYCLFLLLLLLSPWTINSILVVLVCFLTVCNFCFSSCSFSEIDEVIAHGRRRPDPFLTKLKRIFFFEDATKLIRLKSRVLQATLIK